MLFYFYVAFGGALGSVARFGISELMMRWLGADFPWGTLVVNVVGSFVIGYFAAGAIAWDLPPQSRGFFMVGVCGGFTTFSSFSLQTFHLLRDGHGVAAGVNVLLSLLLCFLAVWLGHWLAVSWHGPKGS